MSRSSIANLLVAFGPHVGLRRSALNGGFPRRFYNDLRTPGWVHPKTRDITVLPDSGMFDDRLILNPQLHRLNVQP